MNKDEYEPEEPMVEDPEKLRKAELEVLDEEELEVLDEEELKNQLKEPLPVWAWVFPIVFMFLGGLISWIAFRERRDAVWLFVVGVIVQLVSGFLYRMIY